MILHLHSDAGCNNESKGRSRSGGPIFLGNPAMNVQQHFNGAILNPTHIINDVASSAANAEFGATVINCWEAIPIRIALEEMGYRQPPTIVTLDNTTAVGFANRNIRQCCTKAIDVQYYWLHDQEVQKLFKFVGEKTAENRANYLLHETSSTTVPSVHNMYMHAPVYRSHATTTLTSRVAIYHCESVLIL